MMVTMDPREQAGTDAATASSGAVESAAVVEITGATVRFGAETVLDGVDFRLLPGEVHSLMGENGAGKSTLIKALTGVIPLDAGTIRIGGVERVFASPAAAIAAGVSTVYQEIDLLPNLTVAENICLGREPRRFGAIDWPAMNRRAAQALEALGLDVDPQSVLSTHSLAVQQLVAIARATSIDLRVLVLDEPTSSLDLDEVAELFRVMRELTDRGVAILFVSHFLDQVYEVSDRITVLRGGRLVGEYVPTELLRVGLVEKMLGRSSEEMTVIERPEHAAAATTAVLEAEGISAGRGVTDASLRLAEGEVLGFAGLLGSGRTELARAVAGVDRADAGEITLGGTRTGSLTPRRAIALGLVYSSENRRTEGIIEGLSVQDNITLALQAERGILHRLGTARRRELAQSWIEALDIRPAEPDRPAGTLSGGNQQKVLLARLLALSPRVLVLDEPTRGIDVGAKVEIQRLVGELADNGLSVVFISAELEEVLRVSNRIAVLRGGRLVETVDADHLTVDSLLALVAAPDETGPGAPTPDGTTR